MSANPNSRDSEPNVSFVETALANDDTPVVLFSLSWCSFCRAIKQLLNTLNIIYYEYELDRGEFLEPTLQRQVRLSLSQVTGSTTLPQLFIARESVGGYTETVAALKSGRLQQQLESHNIPFAKAQDGQ